MFSRRSLRTDLEVGEVALLVELGRSKTERVDDVVDRRVTLTEFLLSLLSGPGIEAQKKAGQSALVASSSAGDGLRSGCRDSRVGSNVDVSGTEGDGLAVGLVHDVVDLGDLRERDGACQNPKKRVPWPQWDAGSPAPELKVGVHVGPSSEVGNGKGD